MTQQYNCQKNATFWEKQFQENHFNKNSNRNRIVPPLSASRLPRYYSDNTKPLHLLSPVRGHSKDQAKLTSPVMMNAPDQIKQDLRRQCGGAAWQIIVRRHFDQIDADNVAALT